MKRKPIKVTAGGLEFLSAATGGLAFILVGFMCFDLYGRNLLAAEVTFCGSVLWTFLGIHSRRRYGIQKHRTIGALTPWNLTAAILSTLIGVFMSVGAFVPN